MRILPLRFGDVLAGSVGSLGRISKGLFLGATVVFIPIGVVTLVVFSWTGALGFMETVFTNPGYLQTLPGDVIFQTARPFFVAVAVSLALQLTGTVAVSVLAHVLVGADTTAAPTSLVATVGPAGRALPDALLSNLIAATLIIAMALSGGWLAMGPLSGLASESTSRALLLLVTMTPALWALTWMSMSVGAAVFDARGPVLPLRRSFELVRPRFGATLGYLTTVGLIPMAALALIQTVAMPLLLVESAGSALRLMAGVGFLTQGLIVAAIATMTAGWYVDLRARREALVSENLHPLR